MVRRGSFLELCWVFSSAFWRRVTPGLLLALSLAGGAGCRSTDNFSRIVNEPEPLPESVRTNLGVVGLLPASASLELAFEPPATPGEVMMKRSAQTFGTLAGAALAVESQRTETI